MKKKYMIGIVAILTILLLSGCTGWNGVTFNDEEQKFLGTWQHENVEEETMDSLRFYEERNQKLLDSILSGVQEQFIWEVEQQGTLNYTLVGQDNWQTYSYVFEGDSLILYFNGELVESFEKVA